MSVVSVRVDKRVKEMLEKEGVNIADEIRRFLSDLAWRIELRRALERLDESLKDVPPAEIDFSVRSVRGDREDH
ncbi:VapB-type antitoxin [Candidatus Bathyarchaeota archaeon]|nr:MAG: VapB-type antitoxin [Candidatus Bathyarchaeota archaeon]